MHFKEATSNDIALIQELAKKSWGKAYANILSQEQLDYMLSTMYGEKEIQSHIEHNPNYHYHLIFDEKNAVGFIGFEHHYEPKTTKLHRIYLLEEAKGKGLGKAGIEFLKKQTLANNDHRIILNVNKNNTARTIYEKQGFQVYEEGVFDIGNGFVMDDFLMELYL